MGGEGKWRTINDKVAWLFHGSLLTYFFYLQIKFCREMYYLQIEYTIEIYYLRIEAGFLISNFGARFHVNELKATSVEWPVFKTNLMV